MLVIVSTPGVPVAVACSVPCAKKPPSGLTKSNVKELAIATVVIARAAANANKIIENFFIVPPKDFTTPVHYLGDLAAPLKGA
jgi:hypothetical protein